MSWLRRIVDIHESNNRMAVGAGGAPVTGRQLIGKVTCAADYLTGLALPRGVPVPALCTTNADTVALILGGAAADHPLAPLGPRLAVDELSQMVSGIGAPILLTEPAFAALARGVAERSGVRVVSIQPLPCSDRTLVLHTGPALFHLHTAGTTGNPKIVAFTDAVLAERAQILTGLIGFDTETVYATGSPIHHIGGIGNLLAVLTAGGAVLSTPRFDVQWWRNLRNSGVTHALLVPTMIEMLLGAGALSEVGLSTLIYGAAPMRVDTLARVMRLHPGMELFNLFGQTEGSPICCLDADDHRRALERPALLDTVGRPVADLRLRIDSDAGTNTGEILAQAPHLSVHSPDGWLHTGDIGTQNDSGYVQLRGRRHDMIIRGGENVYPSEVERVLLGHPDVKGVGVVGVTDARLGETVAAFVVPVEPDNPPDAVTLHRWARSRMAGFKVPTYWYIVDDLPLNTAGKLARHELRKLHCQ